MSKASFRSELATIAAEMNHGGFFRRLGDTSPNTQCASRLQAEYINVVSDFGAPRTFAATPQGTDAAPAINGAINAAAAAGGGTVYVPSGFYWVQTPVILKPLVRLTGAGPNITTIKNRDTAANHVVTHLLNSDVRFALDSMTIDGNRSTTGNRRTWYDCVNIATTVDSFHNFFNLMLQNATRDSLHLSGTRSVSSFYNIFCGQSGRHGIHVTTFDNLFTHFNIAATGADGMWVQGGPNCFCSGKIYFAGNGTMFFNAFPNNFFGELMLGSATSGFDNTAPVASDWQAGCGIRNHQATICDYVGVEIQDTWGPGFIESGWETRFNGIIGNVGDLAPGGPRHSSAAWPATTDRYPNIRAAVQLEGTNTADCTYNFTTRAQSVRFNTGTTSVTTPCATTTRLLATAGSASWHRPRTPAALRPPTSRT